MISPSPLYHGTPHPIIFTCCYTIALTAVCLLVQLPARQGEQNNSPGLDTLRSAFAPYPNHAVHINTHIRHDIHHQACPRDALYFLKLFTISMISITHLFGRGMIGEGVGVEPHGSKATPQQEA